MPTYASQENSRQIQQNVHSYYNYFAFSNPLYGGIVPRDYVYEDIMTLLDKIERFLFLPKEERPFADPIRGELTQITDYLKDIKKGDNRIDYEAWRQNITTPANGLVKALDDFNEQTDYRYTKTWPIRLLIMFVVKLNELDKETRTLEAKEKKVSVKNTNKNPDGGIVPAGTV